MNGADRQDAHEVVRGHAIEVARLMKEEGSQNNLLERLATEPMFKDVNLAMALDPSGFIGRAPEQVDSFCDEIVNPIRNNYNDKQHEIAQLRV
jgi:adenylosuccinate lyase